MYILQILGMMTLEFEQRTWGRSCVKLTKSTTNVDKLCDKGLDPIQASKMMHLHTSPRNIVNIANVHYTLANYHVFLVENGVLDRISTFSVC